MYSILDYFASILLFILVGLFIWVFAEAVYSEIKSLIKKK